MTKPFRATLCTRGFIGYRALNVWVHDFGRKPYAQYSAAAYVIFVEKGKRTKKQWCEGDAPSAVLLKGWDARFKVPDPMTEKTIHEGTGLVVQESRYSSCDPRYTEEFNKALDAAVAAGTVEVVFDARVLSEEA